MTCVSPPAEAMSAAGPASGSASSHHPAKHHGIVNFLFTFNQFLPPRRGVAGIPAFERGSYGTENRRSKALREFRFRHQSHESIRCATTERFAESSRWNTMNRDACPLSARTFNRVVRPPVKAAEDFRSPKPRRIHKALEKSRQRRGVRESSTALPRRVSRNVTLLLSGNFRPGAQHPIAMNRRSATCSGRGTNPDQAPDRHCGSAFPNNLHDRPGSSAYRFGIMHDAFPASIPLLSLSLPGLPPPRSGKVREVFDLGDALLFVATDRISAFDCVMPNGIPRKGEVLTQLSHFWFDLTEAWLPNHRLSRADDPLPPRLAPFAAQLARRSMIVKKAQPLAIECVVRGYLAGSGWKEYRRQRTVCGIHLPAGLTECAALPEPIFTPATKAETGHDENISFATAEQIVGADIAAEARRLSLRLYATARDYARQRGILIADTKFEFGIFNGQLILIDEVLTPDSSRFWPADQYAPGRGQPSYDKQFVRDYLETLAWDKTPPAPALPPEVVARTQAKYLEAYERLTGHPL